MLTMEMGERMGVGLCQSGLFGLVGVAPKSTWAILARTYLCNPVPYQKDRFVSATSKSQLSKTDICDRLITPALEQAGWTLEQHILRAYTLRPGHLVVRGAFRAEQSRIFRNLRHHLAAALMQAASRIFIYLLGK